MAVETSDYESREAAESERALLGALMRDSARAWPQVKDVVTAYHFARPDHRKIFEAITAQIAETGEADPLLVIDRLGEAQLEAAGGRQYIAELFGEAMSGASAGAYAKTIRKHAGRNKVIDLAAKIAERVREGSTEEAAAFVATELERLKRDFGGPAEPLDLTPVSAWAAQPPPAPRSWILEGMIPAGRVTSMLGPGGRGKTLVALQIALHVSLGRTIFGLDVVGGPVLGIFCEDERDELDRRLRAACAAERIDLESGDRLVALSRDGFDNILCTFEHDHMKLTAFYSQLDATIAALTPTLVILDTAADIFAGDFMSTTHVRQFIKTALGGFCRRHGCAVLLLAHPSKSGQASGEGDGFSTAWSNSVRSRLYFSQPSAPDPIDGESAIDVKDKRVLEVKKSNYASGDTKIPLLYENGCFVLDREPIGVGPSTPRTKTARVALAALDHIRSKAPLVVGFREIFDVLHVAGILAGSYDESRKPLNRALQQLLGDGTVIETRTPRGYRLNPELK